MKSTFAVVVILASLALILLPAPSRSAAPPDRNALLKARAEAAQATYEQAAKQFEAGTGTVEAVYSWSVRWMNAQADKQAAARDHLTRMKALEEKVKTRVDSGMSPAADKSAALYYRAEAEVWAAGG
jgi:hypothetical protein